MRSLEDRLRWIEDRWAINDLQVRYAVACDDHDIEGLATLFAEDAIFVSGIVGETRGRKAIADYYEKQLGEFGVSYHIPYSHAVERISSTEARGVLLGAVEIALNGEAFWAALRYLDHYVKDADGDWKFFRRDVQQLYAMPLADLPVEIAGSLRKRWPGTEPAIADLPEGSKTWQDHQARIRLRKP